MDMLQLVSSPSKGHLDHFRFLMVMNKSVTNISPVDFCVAMNFPNQFGKCSTISELIGEIVSFPETAKGPSGVAVLCCCPTFPPLLHCHLLGAGCRRVASEGPVHHPGLSLVCAWFACMCVFRWAISSSSPIAHCLIFTFIAQTWRCFTCSRVFHL